MVKDKVKKHTFLLSLKLLHLPLSYKAIILLPFPLSLSSLCAEGNDLPILEGRMLERILTKAWVVFISVVDPHWLQCGSASSNPDPGFFLNFFCQKLLFTLPRPP